MALLSEIYPLQTGPSGATGPVGATGPFGATGPQGIGVTGATGPIPPGLFYATGDQVISGEKTFLADSFVFSGANVQFIEGTGTVSGAWNFQVRPTLNNHGLISANDLSGLAQNVIPATSGVYDLGTIAKPFKDLYLSSGSLYLGGAVITASGTSVVLPQNTVIQGGGALGATGPQGATGPAGADGSTGATGPAGSNGATGATGTAGSNGATGATGSAGTNGATGATGLGATGATGIAGVAGDKYTTTSTTSQSIGTGSKTFTVDTGLALSIGQQVIVAYDASNKMEGTVTSYSGSTLVVNITSVTGSGGPYTSWSISLSGAPGPAGATGVGTQGATGATGTAGSNGATGATGPAGSNGATGATGTAGSNGATGATGTAGTNGSNGSTGATGPTGTAGSVLAVAGYSWVHGATGATDDYGNLSNGADNVMRFNTQIFNTDSNTFALVNSGTTTARIEVKSAGYYEFTSQVHLFDLFNNVDVTVKLLRFEGSTGGTGALVSLLSDFKAAELTADQLINGTIVVNITSPGYYSVIVIPSANSPFPSDSDSTPTRVFVKKLSN